jgi:hypothetical protein
MAENIGVFTVDDHRLDRRFYIQTLRGKSAQFGPESFGLLLDGGAHVKSPSLPSVTGRSRIAAA